MCSNQSNVKERFCNKISIRYCVERVCKIVRKSHFFCSELWVKWQRRSSKSTRTQCRNVESFDSLQEPVNVACKCPGVSKQMMSKKNWLSTLQMCVARQIHAVAAPPSRIGTSSQYIAKFKQLICKRAELSLSPQSNSGDTLIIATTTCMHLATNLASNFGDATLYRCMNVFIRCNKNKRIVAHLSGHKIQGILNRTCLLF